MIPIKDSYLNIIKLLSHLEKQLIGCLNMHGTRVTANNSTNNNVVFFFVLNLEIVHYNNN